MHFTLHKPIFMPSTECSMLDISLHTVVGLTLFVLYAISVLGLVLVILLENRNPLKTISWVIVLLTLPGIGLVFYFFFGQDNRRQRIISRRTYKRIMKPCLLYTSDAADEL